MNLWGFRPGLIAELERRFADFLRLHHHDVKSEFQLPKAVDEMIHDGTATVKVIDTESAWFGVTYREDRAEAEARLRALVASGVYPSPLWA